MAWNLYSGSRETFIRCFENDKGHELRLIVKSDGNYQELILMCLSFSFTVGLGYLMGADSIVGAVAQGRIGRQVIVLFGTMVLTTVFLLSTVHFNIFEVESPSSTNKRSG